MDIGDIAIEPAATLADAQAALSHARAAPLHTSHRAPNTRTPLSRPNPHTQPSPHPPSHPTLAYTPNP
eukprot:200382-Prymnesium_polylepis.1